MSEPFIYIASYQVKPGHLEEARHRLRDVSALVEEREPQLRSFHFYLDQARERVICVQIHPNAEPMATHMAMIATIWPHRTTTRTSTITRSSLPASPATGRQGPCDEADVSGDLSDGSRGEHAVPRKPQAHPGAVKDHAVTVACQRHDCRGPTPATLDADVDAVGCDPQ